MAKQEPEPSGISDKLRTPGAIQRAWRWLLGAPRDLRDGSIFHKLSLVAVLAWIGLGADALSSSAYGPEEAFKAIIGHEYLALPLALATAATVFLIATAYSKVIEVFPNGGGYGVAARLLGPRVGAVSGAALLIDYVLTITASIAAMGDATFSLLPPAWLHLKLPIEAATIIGLIVLNLRGVRESIVFLAPIFLVFLLTHVLLIGGGLVMHAGHVGEAAATLSAEFHRDRLEPLIGLVGMMAILLNAYALGGGTYTGIEAVSNALPLMREPRVQTAKRTMLYLAVSLALTAGGLILCYLLWGIRASEENTGQTLNAVLARAVGAHLPWGGVFVWLTLLAEALLLVIAAQAGFVGGPRVMANMAVDGWLPRRFAALSDRLTTGNGVVVMGGAALIALLGTQGSVDTIVIMYSINVFLTFTLTMAGMCRHWWRQQNVKRALRTRRLVLFGIGLATCGSILGVTVWEKFGVGGWITIAATAVIFGFCLAIRTHYTNVGRRLLDLYQSLEVPPPAVAKPDLGEPDPKLPVAVVLVAAYRGPGIHTTLNVFKMFPGHFKGLIFCSVAVLDSGDFKGEDAIAALQARSEEQLRRYRVLANGLGVPSAYRLALGTDAVEESVKLCRKIREQYPKATFFAGKVLFERDTLLHMLLHNDTAFAIQRRLQWDGLTTVVVPARCRW